jgi:CHAT domain-containing protein
LIADPPTPFRKLEFTSLEVAWIQESGSAGNWELLTGPDASRDKVIVALPNFSLAHFCTHGIFETADPLHSRLLLANGEALSLDTLLPLLKNTKLSGVILSACETAVVPSWRFADELLGFPAALLSHGAATVIASQWPVDDWASAALIGEFYRQWRTPPGKSPAQALHAAQGWLRTFTADELYDLLDPLTSAANPLGLLTANLRTSLFARDPEQKPFDHPYYWAAFTVSGV